MHIVWIACLAGLVVDREIRHVDADIGAGNAAHGGARALEAFQDRLEQLSLLRIHICGFEVVDTEKIIIEVADVLVDEVAAGHVGAAAAIAALWMVIAIDIVSVRWNRSLSGLLVDNKLPETFGRRDVAGKAASCDKVRRRCLLPWRGPKQEQSIGTE